MKITRLTPPIPTLISEAKINSPHLSGQSTEQLLKLLNRKQDHASRPHNRNSTAVFRTLGYGYDSIIYVVPLFTDATVLKEYLRLLGAANMNMQSQVKKFYLAPKDYYVEYTNVNYGDGYNDSTKYIAGRRKLIVGSKEEFAKYGMDEEDFQEFADYMEREDLRNSTSSATSLKSQITRVSKRHNDEQMAAKAAAQPAAPVATNAPAPPTLVQGMKGAMLPNPYYMGSNQYNGPIINTQWQDGRVKNLMTTFILAADILGDPIDTINHSADTKANIDFFYARSRRGTFVFYVSGENSRMARVIINGTAYSLRSTVITNKVQETVKHLKHYYLPTGWTAPA